MYSIISWFICRGRKVYEPPRYLSANDAIGQLLEIVEGDEEIPDKECKFPFDLKFLRVGNY